MVNLHATIPRKISEGSRLFFYEIQKFTRDFFLELSCFDCCLNVKNVSRQVLKPWGGRKCDSRV